MTILPDERSNSVVVSGTVGDIRLIQELIDKIDIVLAQVRIEVHHRRGDLSDTDTSGISALGLTVGQNAARPHVPRATRTDPPDFDPASVAGWDFTSGRRQSPLLRRPRFNPTSRRAAKNLVKILSAPVIVTTHNKPARGQVGEQLPIITGSPNYAAEHRRPSARSHSARPCPTRRSRST